MGLGQILIVLAFVLFLLAAVLWQPPTEPYRIRFIAAGLACWVLSLLLGGGLKL